LLVTDDITFSSSKLINDYFDVYPPEIREYLNCIRQKYTADFVTEKLYSLDKLKVLVIGDTIIDQYHYCVPMGKSSKEPIVANRYISDESFAGGSLATANNLASVCGGVDLLTVLGKQNSFEEFITERLSPNIVPHFFYREDVGTIVKRRYVTHGTCRKLFEICYIDDEEIPPVLQGAIHKHLRKVISKYDLVVVNDFGHGLLTGEIIDFVAHNSKYLAVNVQTNSANIGFNLVTKYPCADCVCVDEAEMRYATHDRYGDLRSHAKQIYELLKCKHIVTTRGSSGALSYSASGGYVETPAFSYRVVDAIGAGDAFFAFVAPCFAVGLPQDLVSFIGNAVGSLAVQIVCNREPVKLEDLLKFITRLLK
jgi:bifunctional ADP-heptose synthase (sugar kinase/adenylyltransferase)